MITIPVATESGYNAPMNNDDGKFYAPDATFIEALAQAAVASFPNVFRSAASLVVLQVADFVPDEYFDDLGLEDPYELTGLYQGIPLTEKTVADQPSAPDVIWLFRRPILDEWAERGNICLADLVTHVLVHEMAHHFGWDDDDIAAIDPSWE